MAVLRANIPNLIKVDLDSVLQENWKNLTHEAILNLLFNVSTDDKKEVNDLTVGGVGLPAVKNEGTDLTPKSWGEGYKTTYTHKAFGMYLEFTKEALDDEQYGAITKAPAAIARAMDANYNYYMARIYGYATSTTDDFITGGDGKALLATDHPCKISGGTYSNTLSTAADLSKTTLWSAVNGFCEMLDDAGKPIAIMPKYLVVPHQGRQIAYELTESEKDPESAENAINALRKVVSIEVVPWPYWLGSIDSDCWFLQSDKSSAVDYPLKFFRRTPYETESENEFYSKNFLYSVFCRFSAGYSDPRFIYGSLGG